MPTPWEPELVRLGAAAFRGPRANAWQLLRAALEPARSPHCWVSRSRLGYYQGWSQERTPGRVPWLRTRRPRPGAGQHRCPAPHRFDVQLRIDGHGAPRGAVARSAEAARRRAGVSDGAAGRKRGAPTTDAAAGRSGRRTGSPNIPTRCWPKSARLRGQLVVTALQPGRRTIRRRRTGRFTWNMAALPRYNNSMVTEVSA